MKAARKTLMALTALGMGVFLPKAAAELPLPGEYKGTVTIIQVISGRAAGEPEVTTKTVYKATGRLDAEGFVRIAYAGEQAPVFGQLNDMAKTLTLRDQLLTAEMSLKRFSFTISSPPAEVLGPFDESVPLAVNAITKMTRVGK